MRSVGSQRGYAGRLRLGSRLRARLGTTLATTLGAVLIAAAVPVRAGPPADLFDEIYRRGQPIEQSLKTIRARFTETTTSTLLVKPLVAEGTLLAVRPHDILLSYTAPERRLVRIDATTLRFLWPDRQLRESKDIRESQARVQKYFVDKTPDQLRSHFTITAAEDRARPGTWHVVMVPKRKQIKQGVTKIELWLAQKTSLLETMTLTFAGGDTKTMAFSQVEVNPPITLADLALPAS
jgi:outer membrane lipoprotein-sorting protein